MSAELAVRQPAMSLDEVFAAAHALVAVNAAALPAARPETVLSALPSLEARRVDEIARYCLAVWRTARDNGISERAAAQVVARRDASLYPILSKAGKRGASALSYRNFVLWVNGQGKKVGLGRDSAGRPRTTPEAKLVLARDYQVGPRPRPGAAEWWRLFDLDYRTDKAPPLATCYMLACQAYRTKYPVHAAEDIPELHQVRYWIDHHADADELALARKGETWMVNNTLNHAERDWGMVVTNQCWIADNRQVDWFCQVPDGKGGVKAERPQVTLFIDGHSRAVLGFSLKVGAHNRITILQTLEGCIRACGNVPPEVVYVDNGKDYAAQGFLSPAVIEGHEHSVALALGLRVVFAIPYNAKAKLAENFYRLMATTFDRLFPSYSGASPDKKPGELSIVQAHPEGLPTVHQAEEFLRWWITRYNERPSRARHIRGQSPAALQEAARRQPLRPALSDDELARACRFPVPKAREVQRGGRITLDKVVFQGPALRSQRWIGEKVLVKVDTHDASRVYVHELDGTPIGEAERVRGLHPLLDAEEAGKVAARERRWLSQVRVRNTLATGGQAALTPAERLPMLEPGYQVGAPELAEVPAAAALPEPVADADLVRLLDEALYERPAETAEVSVQVVAPTAPVARESAAETTDLTAFLDGLAYGSGERCDDNHDEDGGLSHGDE